MSIRPIDLQTNMSQVTEVGKDTQARAESIVQQQHLLEKESGEKARLANTKLEESKKGDSAVIKDQQKKEGKREHGRGGDDSGGVEGGQKKKKRSTDDRMGRIIDILK